MSDETTNAGAAGGNGAAAAEQVPPVIRIVAHYVRDLSFENVAAQEGNLTEGQPEISVGVNLDAKPAAENRFVVSMQIKATAKVGESTRFLVELDYAGVFEIQNVPQEHMHPVLFIECPRQLLPYARRVVSDVTRDGGYPPLMLDNVDFSVMYRVKLEELRAAQEASSGQA